MHRELAPQGIDVVTVCLDVEGRPGAAPDLAAVDEVTHFAVVDDRHAVDAALGITNVPMGVWVDEDLRLVRPPEGAWPVRPPGDGSSSRLTGDLPERFVQMGQMAGRIAAPNRDTYVPMLRDWAEKGADSAYVLDAEEVIRLSGDRGTAEAQAAAHFELGQHLHRSGDIEAAVVQFRQAHRLFPDNWTYKRQAWELASRVGGPLDRFWQGPRPGHEDEWPYDGDWLTDIARSGPENYYPR